MANNYRFQDTLQNLRDCYEHMDDENLSKEEQRSKKFLIKECKDLVSDHGYELDED